MKESEQEAWYLPQAMKLESLLDAINTKFSFAIGQPQEETFTYFDTFDWRLYRSGFHLQYVKNLWRLKRCDSAETIELTDGPIPEQRIFSWDFPAGTLRTRIESVTDVRGLLPLATLESTTTSVRILNKDEKTVGLLFFECQQTNGKQNILHRITIQGVRGYDKQKQSICNLLHSLCTLEPSSLRHNFEKALRSIGRTPGDYDSKFSIQLAPRFTARQAAVSIYSKLLATMLRNEEGILNDLDSEFLHDFRVAIRRTRAGLSQIKEVLPPDITDHFKKEFAHLGNITGPTRDLDVYMLYENNYKSRLPPSLRMPLHIFFSDLAERRTEEQKILSKRLKTTRYRQIINEWRQYLNGDGGSSAEDTDTPAIDIARRIIFRRYKKILRAGREIAPETPDENLHRLRIQGKKLRYSLEFFASLFPNNEIKNVIKQLKRLQNNLGDFNDLSVQQDMLHQYLKELKPGSRRNFELATAIGGLLTNLYHEQCRVRKNFLSTFSRFSSGRNVALFNKLFN
ncbi:MAG TPA: CHAD domain-containing protein [Desulfobacterales bacterium]|nr:CHAD domain-containing protein [Desulfobacterales bacterium]HIP40683.1 CHAD domain-containing protein [Desulfocapsa sulfexigens]